MHGLGIYGHNQLFKISPSILCTNDPIRADQSRPTCTLNGGFSVQHRQASPFRIIAVDPIIETVNKDTQTSGMTRGFSLNQGAVSKYYLTAEHRTEALRQLRLIAKSRTWSCISAKFPYQKG
jgi:hypothetical protein